jgi:hypothetical protein
MLPLTQPQSPALLGPRTTFSHTDGRPSSGSYVQLSLPFLLLALSGPTRWTLVESATDPKPDIDASPTNGQPPEGCPSAISAGRRFN